MSTGQIGRMGNGTRQFGDWGEFRSYRAVDSGFGDKRIAFTLLELLVVIAIIALLTAILLPALGQARSEGSKAQCLSKMREIGRACMTYSMSDASALTTPVHAKAETDWIWDGEYEYGGKTGLGVMGHPDLAAENRILNRYISGSSYITDYSLYQCPQDEGIPDAPNDFDDFFLNGNCQGKSAFDAAGTSYRLNNHIDFFSGSAFSQDFFGPYMRVSTRVPNPGETVILEETVAEVAKWNAPNYVTTGWHRKVNIFNVAFVDGHAAAIRLAGQQDWSAQYPGYWVLRGEGWRMDCYPDKPIPDLP